MHLSFFSRIKAANIMFMKAPIFKSTRAQANFHPEKTFLYTFDYRGEHSYADVYNFSDPLFRDFVQHGDELIYTLAHPHYAKHLNMNDTEFAKILVDLWTSFAKTGVPESERAPQWPPLSSILTGKDSEASYFVDRIFSFGIIDFAGPYLHIDKQCWVDENFMDELSVVSREAYCSGAIGNSVRLLSVSIGMFLILILGNIW